MNMERYSRQLLFSPIQAAGQKKLADSTALIVGVGALGTVISNHLVRAGVGKVRIVDRDYVELSNLQRQMLFDEADVNEALPKAIAAKRKLEKINSDVVIEAFIENVSNENVDRLTDDVDVVLDGTDNFSTRFLLNDICFKKNIPFSYGGVVSSRGMTALFIPNETPCLRCFTKEGSESGQTCDTVGVIAPAVDMISSMEVIEVLKYLTGNKQHLRHTLKTVDFWYNQHYDMKFSQADPQCPTCQKKEYPAIQKKAQNSETVLCGRNTVQIHRNQSWDLAKIDSQLAKIMKTKRTPFLVKAQMDNEKTFVIFPDGRVLVQGTEDITKARTLYDRYIGS
ncbi:ThiF family adenylyltransferase [Lentibacillus sp. Marseille-P4043]|uniref:ThiF family adenylyltransferase n=1 Tax=Lentibacillus sp. Marseille-P4043 TaxID=2040293 RepID=UPI000D0B6CCA|nr:ThiF family adenylyltransferase [Lentibacillus sp. Marseille-P4043]